MGTLYARGWTLARVPPRGPARASVTSLSHLLRGWEGLGAGPVELERWEVLKQRIRLREGHAVDPPHRDKSCPRRIRIPCIPTEDPLPLVLEAHHREDESGVNREVLERIPRLDILSLGWTPPWGAPPGPLLPLILLSHGNLFPPAGVNLG